jgi:hypothetical protein
VNVPSPSEPLRGGRYVVTKTLGEGSQGSTFEAVDKKEGRLVAIKRFDVRGAKAWKDVELAEREARVLSSLEHPSLPAYIEHFEEGGRLYLVMEKIEGKSLGQMLKDGERLSEREVVHLLEDAGEVLEYLRTKGVVHRDLKPGNVILRDDGSFAFVDFGAVRDRFRAEGGSTVVGTFGYMAPEQFQGRALPASDVYAIGATSVAMLTGRQPEDLPHRGLALDVPEALRGVASERLVRTLSQMLEPDPERRAARIEAPRAQSFADAFRGARQDDRKADPTSRFVEREVRRATRRAERRARKEARRAVRDRGHGRLPFIPYFFVVLGLAVARLAVTLALFVAVPTLLTLLSLLFGPSLRAAARAVSLGGRRAYDALDRRAREFRDGQERAWADEPAKVRVEAEADRVRVGEEPARAEPEEDEDDASEERRKRRR